MLAPAVASTAPTVPDRLDIGAAPGRLPLAWGEADNPRRTGAFPESALAFAVNLVAAFAVAFAAVFVAALAGTRADLPAVFFASADLPAARTR
ncbi:MAG: hypothetical protein H7X95_03800 [Deltaproteobacteria bacterium]|nr:hypothetical protein [Deltaproteobacteria bacterium]